MTQEIDAPEGGAREEKKDFDPEAIIEKMRAEYWEAVERTPEAEPEDLVALLKFRVGSERFAFRVEQVREVTRVPPLIARVPRSAEFLLGVMNLRGQIIPLLDLRLMLGFPGGATSTASRVLILRGPEGDLGILTEEVLGLVTLSESEWLPPLKVDTALPATFIKAQAQDAEGLLAVLDNHSFLTLDSLGTDLR
ncbi:MAG: chemotaxis protein CheW [Planctomycetota bacterium]|jgi:chemotaxis signal transduction protein